MKNKGITILLIITNIILIAILCSFIKINGSILKEKQIIKEMSESTQVTDLNNQINALNTEHTEYMNYIQTCKAQLASAITDMGVETLENASVDTIVSNIRSITGKEIVTLKTRIYVYVMNPSVKTSGNYIDITYTINTKTNEISISHSGIVYGSNHGDGYAITSFSADNTNTYLIP